MLVIMTYPHWLVSVLQQVSAIMPLLRNLHTKRLRLVFVGLIHTLHVFTALPPSLNRAHTKSL